MKIKKSKFESENVHLFKENSKAKQFIH